MNTIRLLSSVLSLLLLGCETCAQDFSWGHWTGGYSTDVMYDFVIDSHDNVVGVGYFWGSVDFDPSASSTILDATGNGDAFISKYTCEGALDWAIGIDADKAIQISQDQDNNLYILGTFSYTVDFDPGSSVHNLTSTGSDDIFLLKLSCNGDFVWVKQLGCPGNDWVWGMDMDSNDNLYIAGTFHDSIDLDPSSNSFIIHSSIGIDGYFSKYNKEGEFLLGGGIIGGSTMRIWDLHVDPNDELVLVGDFRGPTDFDPGSGIYVMNTSSSSQTFGFVAKYDTLGSLSWAKKFVSDLNSHIHGIDSDQFGNLYLAGYFTGTCDLDPGTLTSNVSAQWEDGMIVKLGHNGTFKWGHSFGAFQSDYFIEARVRSANDIFFSGEFRHEIDFDPGTSVFLLDADTSNTAIIELDSSGVFLNGYHVQGGRNWPVNLGFTDSGSLVLTGVFADSINANFLGDTVSLSSGNNLDFWLTRVSYFNESISCNEPTLCDTTGSVTGVNTDGIQSATIYPNPTSGHFKLVLPDESRMKSITIYNSTGRVIDQISGCGRSTFEYSLVDTKGIYYVMIVEEKGFSRSFKLIID